MKKLIIPFLLSLTFLSVSVAQTADAVLVEYFETIGQDKLLETNTYVTKGKILQAEFEIPFTAYNKKPMSYRLEAEFQGMKIITAFNGVSGWSINPMMGSTEPQPMTDEQIEKTKLQADYDGIYYNYAEKGYTVEFVGKDFLDDIEVYILKLTTPTGDIITSYFDTENNVLLKSSSNMTMQDVETEFEMYFSNYKYVDEILVPFAIETKVNGETMMNMVIDEVTYNVDIPDSMFEMPEVTEPADSTGM
jgi:outer membrane lipoprotein-sorting protein